MASRQVMTDFPRQIWIADGAVEWGRCLKASEVSVSVSTKEWKKDSPK
jgi:hypothetical protein